MFRKSSSKSKSNSENTSAAAPPAKPSHKKKVPSVISADMNILGNIISDGIIDFDGSVDGNIRCHSLVLRHNGKVNGEVYAENVQVHGCIKGLIKAKNVQLHSTCSVEGIVMHETIVIEDGAVIEGKIKRTNKPGSAQNELDPGLHETITGVEDSSLEPPRLMDNIRLISG